MATSAKGGKRKNMSGKGMSGKAKKRSVEDSAQDEDGAELKLLDHGEDMFIPNRVGDARESDESEDEGLSAGEESEESEDEGNNDSFYENLRYTWLMLLSMCAHKCNTDLSRHAIGRLN